MIPFEPSEISSRTAEARAQAEELRGKLPDARPTPLEEELLRTTAECIRAWRRSPGADEQLAAMRAMTSPDELQEALHAIVRAPQFAPMWELVARHRNARPEEISFAIGAITLGIEGSIALLIGVEGSIGVAFPPNSNLWDYSNDAMYASGTAMVGVVEAVLGGPIIGFWKSAPKDLGGPSVGVGFEGAFGLGAVVQLSFSIVHHSFLGFSVAQSEGEAAGIDVEGSYTFVWTQPAVYQPPAANYMILTQVECVKASESGHDEVFIEFIIDDARRYLFPTQGQMSMKTGDVWNAGRSMKFNQVVAVSLYDSDGVSGDDFLGGTTYFREQVPGIVQVSGSGATYKMSAVLEPLWETWPAGTRVNSDATSGVSPAACTFGDDAYVFWKGSETGMMYFAVSAGGAPFSASEPVNSVDVISAAPAACEYNGAIWTCFRDVDGFLCTTASTGAPWPRATTTKISILTAPAACVFNGSLLVFYGTPAQQLAYSSYNGSSWSAGTSLPGATTAVQPSACVFNGSLYVFWMDLSTKQILYNTSADGVTWSGNTSINSNETSWGGPSACEFNRQLLVVFPGNGSPYDIRWTASANGLQWPGSQPIYNGNLSTNASELAVSCIGASASVFWTNLSSQVMCAKGIQVGGS